MVPDLWINIGEDQIMSLSYDAVEGFIDYVEYYPMEDELGYDGVHDGGYNLKV